MHTCRHLMAEQNFYIADVFWHMESISCPAAL